MCTILVTITKKPKCSNQLIVLHNRDEFRDRPTLPDSLSDEKIFGTDLNSGGTWLIVSQKGLFCLVINQASENHGIKLKSRGLIPPLFFYAPSQESFLKRLKTEGKDYSPFVAVFGDSDSFSYFDNIKNMGKTMTSGTLVLSSTNPFEPRFKTTRLKELFKSTQKNDVENLKLIMLDDTKEKFDNISHHFLSKEQAYALSSIFVDTEKYGTRSTSIYIKSDSKHQFSEFLHNHGKPCVSEIHLEMNE